MHAAVPAIEIADDADALSIGGPNREVHAGGRAERQAVGPELVPGAVVRPFGKQVEIVAAQDGAERESVIDLVDLDRKSVV